MAHNTPHSEESKRKMSEAHKKDMVNPELRKRISESVKKLWENPEYRKRMTDIIKKHPPTLQFKKGHKFSKEIREKAQRNRLKTLEQHPEIRKRMGFKRGQKAWNKGISPSKETIEKQKKTYRQTLLAHPEIRIKMSEAQKGRVSWIKRKHHSEETKRKLSESHKGRHLSPKTEFKKGQYHPKTEFKKGMTPWNKGKHTGLIPWNKGIPRTKKQIEKQRATMKKLTSSPEYRKKMSETFKKAWANPELRKQQSERIKNYLFSNPKARKVLRAYVKGNMPWNKGIKGLQVAWNKGLTGEKSTSWKGGLSFEPYSPDWTDILKETIRQRDNYTCQLCGKTGYPVHHIDYNKKNCNPENLVTLCKNCHTKTNWNRAKWIKFFKGKNYRKK